MRGQPKNLKKEPKKNEEIIKKYEKYEEYSMKKEEDRKNEDKDDNKKVMKVKQKRINN